MRKSFFWAALIFLAVIFAGNSSATEQDLILAVKGTTSEKNNSISIDHDFYIGRFEITQAEYEEVMKNNPSFFIGDSLPVESVTWYDAVAYCNERSKREKLKAYYGITRVRRRGKNIVNADVNVKGGDGYRLPTSEEWEYAARGGRSGNATEYAGSDSVSDSAWFYGNSKEKTNEVGKKEPNELGIYDMSGNVFEWTDTERQGGRIIRGGSWDYYASQCAVSFLHVYDPDNYKNSIGFRVARNAE